MITVGYIIYMGLLEFTVQVASLQAATSVCVVCVWHAAKMPSLKQSLLRRVLHLLLLNSWRAGVHGTGCSGLQLRKYWYTTWHNTMDCLALETILFVYLIFCLLICFFRWLLVIRETRKAGNGMLSFHVFQNSLSICIWRQALEMITYLTCNLLDHLYVIMFKLGQGTDQIVLFVAFVEWPKCMRSHFSWFWWKPDLRTCILNWEKCVILYRNALICILFILWFLVSTKYFLQLFIEF